MRLGAERVRLDGGRDLVLFLELCGARKECVVLAAADEEERKQAERDDARNAADGPADDRADVTGFGGGGARREPDDGLAVLRNVEDAVRKGDVSMWIGRRRVGAAGGTYM